jgi:hypothetical protein
MTADPRAATVGAVIQVGATVIQVRMAGIQSRGVASPNFGPASCLFSYADSPRAHTR